MTRRKWYGGPPPSIGWWPASTCKDLFALRWWDGEFWSETVFAQPTHPSRIEQALKHKNKAGDPDNINGWDILWTHRPDDWPAHSYT